MPFKHSIVIAHSEDFKNFLKSIRQIINESGSVYDDWEKSYDNDPIVISTTSKGSAEKITTIPDVITLYRVYQDQDELYQEVLEKYINTPITFTFRELIIEEIKNQYQICLRFNSDISSNLKVDFAYLTNLEVNIHENVIVHKDEDGMFKSQESIYPSICLFSTQHIKKIGCYENKISDLMKIYRNILRFITEKYGSNGFVFESEGFKYVPDNRKCKPIQLWY
jgi:hypothetical protein